MYRPYVQLRVEITHDDIAAALVRLAGGRDDSDAVQAVRALVDDVIDREHTSHLRAFLNQHDVRFRFRRLAFVQDCIDERFGQENDPTAQRDLLELKRDLNDVFMRLRRDARAARSGHARKDEDDRLTQMRELGKVPPHLDPARTLEILSDPERFGAADADFADALNRLLTLTAEHLKEALTRMQT